MCIYLHIVAFLLSRVGGLFESHDLTLTNPEIDIFALLCDESSGNGEDEL